MTKYVFDQRMEYIQTVDLVASRYRQIETDQRHDVRFRYTQWRVQACDEIRYLIERYELCGVWIVSVTEENDVWNAAWKKKRQNGVFRVYLDHRM